MGSVYIYIKIIIELLNEYGFIKYNCLLKICYILLELINVLIENK